MEVLHSLSRPRFLVFVVTCAVLLRLPALILPIIDTDEAGHGVCARELLEGGRLYVDYADNKPPLLYWIYTAVMAIGGRSVLAVHWVGLAWILVGAWATGLLVLRTGFGNDARRWAVLAYIVGSSVYLPNDMLATNGEQLMNPFLVLAVLAWWDGRRPLLSGILAGLLGFAGGLCYQKGWIVLPVLGAWGLWRMARTPERRDWLTRLAGLAGGGVLGTGAVGAILAGQGVLDEALYWNFGSNLRYIGAGSGIASFSLEDAQPHGTIRVAFYVLANLLPLRAIWMGFRHGWGSFTARQRDLLAFLLIWLGASFAALSLGGRYFGHYFLQTVPAWSALFGVTFPLVAQRVDPKRFRRLLRSGFPLAGLAVFSLAWVAIGGLESQHPLLRDLAMHASSHTHPGDRIFVWGYASPVYYYADRQPGARFVYPQSLAGYVPGVPSSLRQDTDPLPFVVWKNWPIALEDLRAKRPAIIYDTAPARFHYWGKFPVSLYPLGAMLDSLYAPVDAIGGVVAYQRIHGIPLTSEAD
ncbi:MAG: hypothetical protein MUE60_00565 [Candidatus Eisenbacteria bacterium]|nr:hypothetical protein [Candidatus Eisenbacteria bacterium]